MLKSLIYLLQGLGSVMFGFTGAQQIQVGTIDDQQIRHDYCY